MFSSRALAVAVTAAVAGLSGTAHAAPCAAGDLLPSAAPAKARSATLCLLNQERTARGLHRLRPNRLLAVAALRHSRDMVRHRYFAHDSRNGRTFDARIKATGYLSGARGWTVGENLAWGAGTESTPRQIVAAWMASPPHRHNILSPRYAQVGIAIVGAAPVAGAAGAATYATEFGRRR